MKRILFSGLLFTLMIIAQSAFGQAENIIYGKKVVVKTRDSSSAELQVINSTRSVPGYLRNIGGGLTKFVLPDYSELINKPTTFPPSSHTHGNADITDLAWTKLTGVPDFVLVTRMIDSLASLQGRINTKLNITDASAAYITITRTIDSLARLQERIQTKEPLVAAGTTSQYYRGDKSWQTLDKTAVGLSNVPNTDATNASNISAGTLADARLSGNVTLQGNSFNAANQLVKLDGSGKLPTSTIPSLAITEPFVVGSQAAMLALSAQTGDLAIRSDEQKTYVLAAEPASTLANWIWLRSPSGESDPVFLASIAYSITSTNVSNWNTAYSWGNHSSAGYAMASRTITINGTAYDLSANRSWTVGDVRTDGSYSNPSWITSLAWAKLTGVPSTFAPSSHTHPISDITSLQTSLDAKLSLSGGTLTGGLSGTTASFNGNLSALNGTFSSGGEDGSAGSVLRLYTTSMNADARNWGIINTWDNFGDLTFRVSNSLGGNPLTTGTSIMTLLRSGSVGIGTTAPASLLQLAYQSSLTELLRLSVSYPNANAKGAITWHDGSSVVGQIDSRYDGTYTTINLGSLYNSNAGGYSSASIMSIRGDGQVKIIGGNGNQILLDNTGQRYTQLSFAHNGTQKSAMWWDNIGSQFVVSSAFSPTGDLTFSSATGAATFISTITTGGNILVSAENSYLAIDATSPRLGFVKKSGAQPFLGFASDPFTIQVSSGSNIAASNTFTTVFSMATSGAATFYNTLTSSSYTTTGNYVYFGSTSHYIYRDSELGWNFTGLGYLKSAATYDANQHLLTSSNVTFNQVNATITGSVGTAMETGSILSGTPRVIRFNIGGTYYYISAYPIYSPPQP